MADVKLAYKAVGNNVVEKTTNQIIRKCRSRKDAVLITAKLIAGCGFEGNTPQFFCIPVKLQ